MAIINKLKNPNSFSREIISSVLAWDIFHLMVDSCNILYYQHDKLWKGCITTMYLSIMWLLCIWQRLPSLIPSNIIISKWQQILTNFQKKLTEKAQFESTKTQKLFAGHQCTNAMGSGSTGRVSQFEVNSSYCKDDRGAVSYNS